MGGREGASLGGREETGRRRTTRQVTTHIPVPAGRRCNKTPYGLGSRGWAPGAGLSVGHLRGHGQTLAWTGE